MKVWSRLLCLVRPDFYCSVASPSVRKQLSEVQGKPQSDFQNRQRYIKLLQLVHASPWFQTSRPKAPDAAQLWKRRAAFSPSAEAQLDEIVDLSPDLRGFTADNYVILHSIEKDDCVLIHFVFRGNQDIDAFFHPH